MENSEIITSLFTTFVTIFIALIAASVAIFQVKLNIISSARINWIEKLRDSFSELFNEYSSCHMQHAKMYSDHRADRYKNNDELMHEEYNKLREMENRITVLSLKIKLFLNPEEKLHLQILENINKIETLLTLSRNKDIHEKKTGVEIQNLIEETTIVLRKIFKKEWEKSKRVFKY